MASLGTILAVDDEALVLRLVRTMLEKSGFTVVTAASGPEALELLTRTSVDLVIADLVMPEMDGTVLAEEVTRRRPGLPVLFISGYPDRLKPLNAPVLAKPFSLAALVDRVHSLLGYARRSAAG